MAAKDPALNWSDLDRRAVDTVRVLAMDAVEKSGNGHPGTAMSLAPGRISAVQPGHAARPDGSRTGPAGTASCSPAGHSSLTLYIQLYLSGYGLALDDLASLRQWDSLTPGHPEYGHTPGVEVTTGPLGQGIGNAVGMAMAARRERGLFDPEAEPGASPFDHHICAICSDGDIEEGVSHEASALAARAEARQPHADLRRQRDLHRGRHPDRQERGRRRPVRGVRLARADRRLAQGRPGRGRLPRGRRGALPGDPGRQGGDRPAVVHRAARPSSAGPRRTSRTPARSTAPRWAPTRSRPPRRSSASTRTRRSRSTRRCSSTPARSPPAAARRTPSGRRPSTPGRRPTPTAGKLYDRIGHARAAARAGTTALPEFPADAEGPGHPGRVRQGAGRARAGAAGAVGRLGRPGREQQHHDEGRAVVHPVRVRHQGVPRPRVRPHAALRHPRARHGLDPQRHRRCTAAPARTAARSWSSATTCAARCGSPR